MLNLNIILKAAVSLSFILKCNIDDNYQDYFSFSGNDTTAHLSRSNETVSLILMSGKSYEIYQSYNISNEFEFEWNGFRIDKQNMKLCETNGDMNDLLFDAYTFFSTKLEIYEHFKEDGEVIDLTYSCKEINYGLISFIVFIIGTFLASSSATIQMWNKTRGIGEEMSAANEGNSMI